MGFRRGLKGQVLRVLSPPCGVLLAGTLPLEAPQNKPCEVVVMFSRSRSRHVLSWSYKVV